MVKARNKLDGRIYAIKKVLFAGTDRRYMDRVLREVMTLSRLSHRHVVRYYQAWLDTADEDDLLDVDADANDQDIGSWDSDGSSDLDADASLVGGPPAKLTRPHEDGTDSDSDSDSFSAGGTAADDWFVETSPQVL